MSGRGRPLLGAALVAFATLAAWRIGTDVLASRVAQASPEQALALRPGHAEATRALLQHPGPPTSGGREQVARALLSAEPLEGWALASLARGARRQESHALDRIAARRAPREVGPRVRLANHALRAGRYAEALRHVDVLLRLKPPYRGVLYPALKQWAEDPGFADALARHLARRPAWRAEFLGTLDPDAGGARALMAGLALDGALDAGEGDRWTDELLRRQRWDEAYAQWAATLRPPPGRLAAVHNGRFDALPSGRGFDWRVEDGDGTRLEFVAAPGAAGYAAHVRFPGRAAAGAGLQHPLFLPPGRHRLTARIRGAALQGLSGLRWTITCGDRVRVIGRGEVARGTFDWKTVRVDLAVPAHGCAGQWLDWANPAPPGAARALSGEAWFDDVLIESLEAAVPPPPAARLLATGSRVLRGEGAGFIAVAAGTTLGRGERLLVLAGPPARLAYPGGCVQAVPRGRVHEVDEARCRATPARRAVTSRPMIDILPEAEAWPLPPIGR